MTRPTTSGAPSRAHQHRYRGRRLTSLTGTLVAALVLAVLPASAAPPERGELLNEWAGTFDDCGFEVAYEGSERIRFLAVDRGPDQLPRISVHFHGQSSWWNAAVEDGPVLIERFDLLDRDTEVADNGDGTLTIRANLTGRSMFSLDGSRLFNDSGLRRYGFVIDHGGTPSDPWDDVVLGFTDEFTFAGLHGTAGRDWCADLTTFLG